MQVLNNDDLHGYVTLTNASAQLSSCPCKGHSHGLFVFCCLLFVFFVKKARNHNVYFFFFQFRSSNFIQISPAYGDDINQGIMNSILDFQC